MMDPRKALTISLAVDKGDSSRTGSPLKIPKTLRSSESGCRKVEAQIHWSEIAEHRTKSHDSLQMNGSMSLDHSQTTLAEVGIDSRLPRIVLPDVLKTEQGQAYLERRRHGKMIGNGGKKRELYTESGPRSALQSGRGDGKEVRKEEPAHGDKNSAASPQGNKRTLSLTPRPHTNPTPTPPCQERRSHHKGAEEEEVRKVIIGEEEENREEVKDCCVLVNRGPAENAQECTKTRQADSGCEAEHTERRRGDIPELCRNGQMKGEAMPTPARGASTDTARTSRGSVLRLSGDARGEGATPPKRLCLEQPGGGMDTPGETMEVGGGSPSPGSGARDRRRSLSSSRDRTTKCSPIEPIVLSSDEEDMCIGGSEVTPSRSSVLWPQPGTSETEPQRKPSQENNMDVQEDNIDSEILRVVVPDFGAPPVPGTEDSSAMGLPFRALHCGGVRGEANGNMRISNQRITIPLKDQCGQVEVILTLDRSELWRYSVWDEDDVQDRGLRWEGGQLPPALLLLFVSDTGALALQTDLKELSIKQAGTTPTGQASPFILLSLRAPLEGVEGALLRSILDIICLNNEVYVSADEVHSPLLSMDGSLALIHSTGLDPQLLSLLGQNCSKAGTNPDQEKPKPMLDSDKIMSLIQLATESEPQTQSEQPTQLPTQLEPQTEQQTQLEPQTEPQPEEGPREAEAVPTTEESSDRPGPVYTLCHHRTGGIYSVSIGPKPGSNWTRYKHQGPARRLIQFPPPPSKGGITVAMEDLECLDNGQFLNDVIIDFYLKYLLLEKAPQAVAEHSHVFSSFFYKQLTRRDNAREDNNASVSAQQRRHQRVKTWTRHVDIFKKDFLFVPVNQESHWYLVVICFPGLEEPQFEAWCGPDTPKGTGDEKPGESQAEEEKKRNGITEAASGSSHSDNQDRQMGVSEGVQGDSVLQQPPSPPDCTEQTCTRETVCKRPCILIMDSLKFSLHERVFKLLREYLQSEWEVRRGSVREFSAEQMKGSHSFVPLQDNSSDCGLYLLQYVESFLQDPVVHFDLPIHLERWFPRQQVRRKRDEIRDLVLNLYRHQRGTLGSRGILGDEGS